MKAVACGLNSSYILMTLVFIEQDWLANIEFVLRPLILPIEQKVFSFSIPRDRWDKEFYQLQGG